MKSKNTAKTVLVISIGFGVIYLLTEIKWTIYTGIIVGILGIISDRICNFIDFIWMKLATILGYIIPNILLSLIFYLFLFPIAFLSKVFGNKNALQLKNTDHSLWIDKPKSFDKSSFEKMW